MAQSQGTSQEPRLQGLEECGASILGPESKGATFEHLLDLIDGMLEDAIKTATEVDYSQPFSEGLKLVAEHLDDCRLRLSLWANDIIHEDPDGDVSIADVLDILEGEKSLVAQELRDIFADAARSLASIQATDWTTGPVSQNDENLFNQLKALRRSMCELESKKYSVQATVSELFRNEIGHGDESGESYDLTPSTSSVLCLDGGGVRSCSSLLILDALMAEIRRRHASEQADSERIPARSDAKPLQPHDVFDYIYGSSSGGLLAIMLGRLKMSERECMTTFENYCGMIFSRPLCVPWPLGGIVLPQYSDRHLIKATKIVVGEFDRSPEAKKWRRNMFSSPGEHCKTAVLAMVQQKNKRDDVLYVFRSFDTNPATGDETTGSESRGLRPADDCQIWQVARATSAAPTYFPPIKINGRYFMDSGIGTNNPAGVAFNEVGSLKMNKMKTILLISLGTGSSRPASRFGTFSRLRAVINTATETEETHKSMLELTRHSGDPYFRFSGPDLDMELDEWRTKRRDSGRRLHTIEFIRQQTMKYLEKDEVRANLRECAELLLDRWRSRKRRNVAAKIARSQRTHLNKPTNLGEKPENKGDLGDQIVASYQQSQFPVGRGEQEFLPEGCLDRLITRASVTLTMGLPDNWARVSAEDKKLINFIVESAKKIFAITITTGIGRNGPELHKAMLAFKAHGFGDVSLPVKFDSWVPGIPLVDELRWNKVELHRFMHHQWTYLAPVIPKTVWDTELESDCILPFTLADERIVAGPFSSVYQVTVHPSHQEAPLFKANGELANFAIKEELMTTASEDMTNPGTCGHWEAEATALKHISSLAHPHLIAVKAIIRKGGKCYFMFPWADGGNLTDFYRQDKRPTLDPAFIKEIFQQLSGLADAIGAMHNFGDGEGSLRHGDLKPQNILRFLDGSEVGILKIADLSLAKYHDEATDFRNVRTETNFGTQLYEPPEVQTMPNKPRSRQYDIWSIGCIYLEVIIWLLYGYDELIAFHDALHDPLSRGRQLWQINPNSRDAKVHPEAVAYIEHMTGSLCGESGAIQDLLHLVRTQLLVVRLPSVKMDAADSPIRADSRTLRWALADILAKGENDKHYWTTGIPRDGLSRQYPRTS